MGEYQNGRGIVCPECKRSVFVIFDRYCPHCGLWLQLNRVGESILSVSNGQRKRLTYDDLLAVKKKLDEQALPRIPRIMLDTKLPLAIPYDACDIATKEEIKVPGHIIHQYMIGEDYFVSRQLWDEWRGY